MQTFLFDGTCAVRHSFLLAGPCAMSGSRNEQPTPSLHVSARICSCHQTADDPLPLRPLFLPTGA